MSACVRVGVCVRARVHPRGTSEMNQISRAVQNFLQEGQTVTRWDCPLTWGSPPAVPLFGGHISQAYGGGGGMGCSGQC